ncbi:MAG TPA: HAMP domain-containing sensor histidine kinase [Pseudomonadales bacterium]|nr:HAMP domain-containing sensor histidine kinase [Pseudomonadales bacterium]
MDAQSLLSTVLASTMHEVKNNLGVLFARIERLVEPMPLADTQKSELNQIKALGDTLNHELVRMLLLYKTNAGGYAPHIEQYALVELFEDAVARHRLTAETHSIRWQIDCDDELLGFFDESLISSVLDTAIFNAAKAGASTITLCAREEDNMLVIGLEDDGPGFPDGLLRSDFTPQARSGNSTGLGLYFAQCIAELHQNEGKKGFLKLSNRKNTHGARLEMYLP